MREAGALCPKSGDLGTAREGTRPRASEVRLVDASLDGIAERGPEKHAVPGVVYVVIQVAAVGETFHLVVGTDQLLDIVEVEHSFGFGREFEDSNDIVVGEQVTCSTKDFEFVALNIYEHDDLGTCLRNECIEGVDGNE